MSKDPKPTHWRSLAELEADPTLCDARDAEFAEPAEPAEPAEQLTHDAAGRRTFLQVMSASLGMAAAATGCRWEKDELLPLSQRPDGVVPGEPRQYSTSVELDGVGSGLLVTSVDGRPIKVDGNPKHHESLGSSTIYQQASILDLYDPDRSQDVVLRQGSRNISSWEEFTAWAKTELAARRADTGRGLAFLVETTSSPTFARLRSEFLAAFPESLWANWSVNNRDESLQGSELAFGRRLRPLVDFDRARVVVSIDADPLSPGAPRSLLAARSLVSAREPDVDFRMNRIYAVESGFSLLGTLADHRLALRSTDMPVLVAELDALIAAKLPDAALSGPQPRPGRPWLEVPKIRKFIDALVEDLIAAGGESVIVVGEQQPAGVHAIAHRLNVLLGSVGKTVRYVEEPEEVRTADAQGRSLRKFVDAMQQGAVKTLIIIGANPVLTTPPDLGFVQALAKVPKSVHLAYYEDETSEACHWHLPQAHALECWADTRAFDGTVGLAQPLILPLFGGRSQSELLALLLTGAPQKGYDLVHRTHAGVSDSAFRQAIRDGLLAQTALPAQSPVLQPLPALTLPGEGAVGEGVELVLTASSNLHDGRFANNAWLVELPDPITKVTWDNAALVAPKTARELGIGDGECVELTVGGRSISVTAVIAPGQAERSIRLALGWGRTAAGTVGGSHRKNVAPVGANAYVLQATAQNPFVLTGVAVRGTGKRQPVASTQDLHAIDQRGREGADSRLGMIVREASLGQFQANPDFAREVVHHPPLLQMWNSPTSYTGHRWAMSVDLNKCIGCNACMVACQAENNVPVVGKADVSRGREMHWIRVDRYYTGTPDDPSISFQPVACQHCENAPCEQVCPVGATMHSQEGLNDMTYNRCIGTRYCSNNCPYKVRRFNYFNYHLDLKEADQQIKKMVFNPDVTVRFRGVMEKCTFCVQRIQRAKIRSKNDKRPLQDGEVTTACQQTCPTGAIVFGDLSDRDSRVSRLHAKPRAYALLEELNNRPRVRYLARIRNPNPKLV
jgi:MoCo/4Fe-4S cofactor protein with predicted Tat translocation signal